MQPITNQLSLATSRQTSHFGCHLSVKARPYLWNLSNISHNGDNLRLQEMTRLANAIQLLFRQSDYLYTCLRGRPLRSLAGVSRTCFGPLRPQADQNPS